MSAIIDGDIPGAWRNLFERATDLIDDVEAKVGKKFFWTLGGGTVLMLRHQHRQSKDIDIFVPDPQLLGYFSPRLSEVAEGLTGRYQETAGHLKLFLPAGEIDIVASPNLTAPGFVEGELLGHTVRLETDAEIVAKKMWHRGDQVKARDLLDLSLVIERSPQALSAAAQFLTRHREVFLEQLSTREDVLREQYDAIDTIKYQTTFDEAVEVARHFLLGLERA
ncbi:MAG: nucleotidyl transferase AbiEii/AbiGii toxin family protein [Betaproteobacteria bacterium]